MIKKTLLLTITILVVYTLFVQYLAPRWWQVAQNTEQENIIKAQNFIYNEKAGYTTIIVGSSLSERIINDSLINSYNLSFGGLGIYDGLNVLSHQTSLPKFILVEMNVAFRKEKPDFASALFASQFYYSKKHVPALRDDKQPIGIAGKIVMIAVYKIKDRIRGVKPAAGDNSNSISKAQTNSAALSAQIINMQAANYKQLPSATAVAYCMNELKNYVALFEKKGVRIIFYEMPVDERLHDLPLPNYVRQTFYADFPPTKYKYIALPGWPHYKTFDGIHLTEEEALKYTSYFKNEIKKAGQH